MKVWVPTDNQGHGYYSQAGIFQRTDGSFYTRDLTTGAYLRELLSASDDSTRPKWPADGKSYQPTWGDDLPRRLYESAHAAHTKHPTFTYPAGPGNPACGHATSRGPTTSEPTPGNDNILQGPGYGPSNGTGQQQCLHKTGHAQ